MPPVDPTNQTPVDPTAVPADTGVGQGVPAATPTPMPTVPTEPVAQPEPQAPVETPAATVVEETPVVPPMGEQPVPPTI